MQAGWILVMNSRMYAEPDDSQSRGLFKLSRIRVCKITLRFDVDRAVKPTRTHRGDGSMSMSWMAGSRRAAWRRLSNT